MNLYLCFKKKKKRNPGKSFLLALKESNSSVAFWSSKINRPLLLRDVTDSPALRRCYELPTRSLGMSLRSEPCFRNTFPKQRKKTGCITDQENTMFPQ